MVDTCGLPPLVPRRRAWTVNVSHAGPDDRACCCMISAGGMYLCWLSYTVECAGIVLLLFHARLIVLTVWPIIRRLAEMEPRSKPAVQDVLGCDARHSCGRCPHISSAGSVEGATNNRPVHCGNRCIVSHLGSSGRLCVPPVEPASGSSTKD